jgi:hypothetical protein
MIWEIVKLAELTIRELLSPAGRHWRLFVVEAKALTFV